MVDFERLERTKKRLVEALQEYEAEMSWKVGKIEVRRDRRGNILDLNIDLKKNEEDTEL